MLRRLHADQPASFEFTPGNLAWAEKQLGKYPPERKASAIIPLLWRAQEQEGWLTRPAIETVAQMLDLAYIRALEVATFYFMFQLHPVGRTAHVQVCGTTSCMICGAEDLIAVCKAKIAPKAHQLSADGRFSWEEVECLGACSNAPMVQIGKDFYEDLTEESFAAILDAFARGETPRPGPQNGRFAAEPKGGATALVIPTDEMEPANGSVAIALEMGDTAARILGEGKAGVDASNISVDGKTAAAPAPAPAPAAEAPVEEAPVEETKPALYDAAPETGADDLKLIKGVGPKLEELLNALGVWTFAQIAGWSAAEVAWVDSHLEGFNGRVSRDGWVEQAKVLAEGGDTEFSARNR